MTAPLHPLAQLAGQDVGGEGRDAAGRWRTYWRDRGLLLPGP